jgi:hypothetical protein
VFCHLRQKSISTPNNLPWSCHNQSNYEALKHVALFHSRRTDVSLALLESKDNFWTTEVRSPALPVIFVFVTTTSRPTLVLIYHLSKGVPAFLTIEWNWPEREAHHLSLNSAEIRNKWTYLYSPIHLHNYGSSSQGHVLYIVEIICIKKDGRGKPGW